MYPQNSEEYQSLNSMKYNPHAQEAEAKDGWEFDSSLNYTVSSKPVQLQSETPSGKAKIIDNNNDYKYYENNLV